MEIGKIIKENRTARNMTQEDLANEFFVSRPLISKWENGRSYPDLEQLLKLSDFFNLTLDELLRGDKKMLKRKDKEIKYYKILKAIIITFIVLLISYYGYKLWWDREYSEYKDSIESKVTWDGQDEFGDYIIKESDKTIYASATDQKFPNTNFKPYFVRIISDNNDLVVRTNDNKMFYVTNGKGKSMYVDKDLKILKISSSKEVKGGEEEFLTDNDEKIKSYINICSKYYGLLND